jgi:hypothetical protein
MSSVAACAAPPGKDCQCGFWALWSPLQCLAKAKEAVEEPPWHVLGLISGWGTVALHGTEGFRAERASVICLFTDWAGSGSVPSATDRRLQRWSRRVFDRRFSQHGRAGAEPDPDRLRALQGAARWHAVPLVSLQGALGLRVLGEWGIPPRRIQEVEAWVAAVATPGSDG